MTHRFVPTVNSATSLYTSSQTAPGTSATSVPTESLEMMCALMPGWLQRMTYDRLIPKASNSSPVVAQTLRRLQEFSVAVVNPNGFRFDKSYVWLRLRNCGSRLGRLRNQRIANI